MRFFQKRTGWTGRITLFLGVLLLFPAWAHSFPVGDAFDKNQGEVNAIEDFDPTNDTPPTMDPSLHPHLNPFYNEPHPFPEYIKKFIRNGNLPDYYRQLLEIHPVDQVQSKIFNEELFRKVRKIGVVGFENKTRAPFKDEQAGEVVANQMFHELQSNKDYQVIPPPQMAEDARFRIIKSPPRGGNSGKSETPAEDQPRPRYELPYSSKKMDAVMIGAVTKYLDSYVDRYGNKKESISSGVEFGAFLISTRTGDVIWAARYVGTQSPGFFSFFRHDGRWLEKRELSRAATKKILRAFRDRNLEGIAGAK